MTDQLLQKSVIKVEKSLDTFKALNQELVQAKIWLNNRRGYSYA
jgi:hypothetical protein